MLTPTSRAAVPTKRYKALRQASARAVVGRSPRPGGISATADHRAGCSRFNSGGHRASRRTTRATRSHEDCSSDQHESQGAPSRASRPHAA